MDEDTLDEKLFETPCEWDTDVLVLWVTPVCVEVLELVPWEILVLWLVPIEWLELVPVVKLSPVVVEVPSVTPCDILSLFPSDLDIPVDKFEPVDAP